MGLESASFITGLNASTPDGAVDKRHQGDDHLRLIKTVVLASLPTASRALYLDGTEVDVASAATCNILGAASDHIRITGTTTITSLGTDASRRKYVRFAGALTLTHNATSLILPGGASITTAAGDTMIVISDASSNCRIYAYQKASGQPVVPTSDPISDDGDGLGTTSLKWSDLFLASGAVINFNSGNVTLTHSAGILSMVGVLALDSTLELGHASDTTFARAAAAVVTIEGKYVQTTDGSSTRGLGQRAFLEYTSNTAVADGATTSGSNLRTAVVSLLGSEGGQSVFNRGAGAVQTGTWKNVSGVAQESDGTYYYGEWERTA